MTWTSVGPTPQVNDAADVITQFVGDVTGNISGRAQALVFSANLQLTSNPPPVPALFNGSSSDGVWMPWGHYRGWCGPPRNWGWNQASARQARRQHPARRFHEEDPSMKNNREWLRSLSRALLLFSAAGVISIIGCTARPPSHALEKDGGDGKKQRISKRDSPSVASGGPIIPGGKPALPAITCVSISPEGKQGLSSCGDTLTLWSLPDGNAVRTFEAAPGNPLLNDLLKFDYEYRRETSCMSVNWKHDIAAAGDWNGMIRVWNLATGKLVRAIRAYQVELQDPRSPDALAVAEDGERIYTCGIDRGEAAAVKVWSLKSGKQIRTLARVGPKPEKPTTLDLLPGSEFPTREEEQRSAQLSERGYKHFFLLKGGDRAILAGNTGYVALWDLVKDKAIWKHDNGKPLWIRDPEDPELLDTTPDGRVSLAKERSAYKLVARGADGQVTHIVTHNSVKATGLDPVRLALVPPGGKRAITVGWERKLVLWELGKKKVIWESGDDHWQVRTIAVSADGKFALVGKENQILQLWNLDRGEIVTVLKQPPRTPDKGRHAK
jgi:WD40 repeat protein